LWRHSSFIDSGEREEAAKNTDSDF
jgi:hypothetical protein